MGRIAAASYVGVTAPDLDKWRQLGTEVLGLAVGPGTTEEKLLLRMDERAWRVSVEPGDGGLAFSGWEVRTDADLDLLAEDLALAGIEFVEDPDLALERRVNRLLRTQDPAGNQVEFVVGQWIPENPFVSPTGTQFKTTDKSAGDLGFGHIVVGYPDVTAAKKFWVDALGFRISDTISAPGDPIPVYFMHVNARHHSLAIAEVPDEPSSFYHMMFEAANVDQVGQALDRCEEQGFDLSLTLGRHTNDQMLSFYINTPSGFEIEYGTDGRLVDDDIWIAGHYDRTKYWGHRKVGPDTH